MKKLKEDWKASLSEEQYRILRQKNTERAFSGEYLNNKQPGIYKCAGCGNPLFSSENKFDSGSGWPSFYDSIDDTHIDKVIDKTWGMIRTEVECASCGGHLGHVFDDGPAPTGLRYCINSASLSFESDNE
ncbi:MAG: peptide-methionine (R)-S-oxide reductase MsrB [Bacteroidetes bacterium]|nr:peptide-methionine (R)-S-oxide reductase MsrB [Bacteroidota bacterium]MCH8234148.1 peptide-methionine (R)-S-oxide reductase MsrB [Bacteroidota bacterium]